MQGRSSIVIAVPPEVVFSFISDPVNDRLWRSYLVASHGTVRGVGDRVTQAYSYQGHAQSADLEVSEYEPPGRLAYRLTGQFRARFSFQCLPDAEGTRVGFSVSSVLTGPAALLEGRFTSEVTKLVHTDLERLKRVLEARA